MLCSIQFQCFQQRIKITELINNREKIIEKLNNKNSRDMILSIYVIRKLWIIIFREEDSPFS